MIIIDVQANVIMDHVHHAINNQFLNVGVDNQVNQHHVLKQHNMIPSKTLFVVNDDVIRRNYVGNIG
jgi:sulfur transfer complex TusBCD TusB component (DsrH family)